VKTVLCARMLRAAMRATRATQTELAEAAGITQVSIHYLLKDDRDPAAHIVVAIADHMDLDPHTLLKKVDGDPGDIPISAAIELSGREGIDLERITGK